MVLDRRYGEDPLSDGTEVPQVRRGFLEEAAFMLRLEVTLRAFVRPRCLLCAHYVLGTVWKAEKNLCLGTMTTELVEGIGAQRVYVYGDDYTTVMRE